MEQFGSNVRIIVRIRPQKQKKAVQIHTNNSKLIQIEMDDSIIEVNVDQILHENSKQIDVFKLFQQSLCKILEGYNMTIFAYGQTGSGKTFTMFGGMPGLQQVQIYQQQIDQNSGLILRCLNKIIDLTSSRSKYNIYLSFLQIYNEKIYDLLQDINTPKKLHESKNQGIFVQGLGQFQVNNYTQCLQLVIKGLNNRFVRQTSMNNNSSRSHTILQIIVQTKQSNKKGIFVRSKISLCDLAGSQKINKKQQINQTYLKQIKSINLSLTALGKVISSLTSINNNQNLTIFRQSKLTRLLQQSLIGNTYTCIIGNISLQNKEQTINTLKFLQRAKHISMKVLPSKIKSYQSQQINNRYNKELQQLMKIKQKGINPLDLQKKIKKLQQQNNKLKKSLPAVKEIQNLAYQNKILQHQLIKIKQEKMRKTYKSQSNSDISQLSIDSQQYRRPIVQINSKQIQIQSKQKKNQESILNKKLNSPKKNSLISAGNQIIKMQSLDKSKIVQKMQKIQKQMDFYQLKLKKQQKNTISPRQGNKQNSTNDYKDRIKILQKMLYKK